MPHREKGGWFRRFKKSPKQTLEPAAPSFVSAQPSVSSRPREVEIVKSPQKIARTVPQPGEDLLMPHIEQLPFDRDLNQVFEILRERNWNVPGITVVFHRYGPNNEHVQPDEVIGPDFFLRLGRRQGQLNDRYYDNAAVREIVIGQEEFGAYKEHPHYSEYRHTMDPGEWSIHYARYTGDNWEADRKRFYTASKFENNPKNPWDYYSGAWTEKPEQGIQYVTPGAMPPYLRYELSHRISYYERDSAPTPDVISYNTQKTIQKFTELVHEKILKPLLEDQGQIIEVESE